MLVHLDPKISMVPGWLISFVLKVMSPFAYNQIVDLLKTMFKDPSTVMARRMAGKPDLYARLHARTAASVPWEIPG